MIKFIVQKNFTDGGKIFKIKQEIIVAKDDVNIDYFLMMAKKGFLMQIELKITNNKETK